MIREILGNEFMDYRVVQRFRMENGVSKAEIRRQKHLEGIKTVEVACESGEKIWLWFDPQQIRERYHAGKRD